MVEHDAMMARFVHDYLELLDHRVASIRSHLEQRNFMTAHVALLSLESTSVMVGADALAQAAGRLREAVEQGERDDVPALLARVGEEADRTRRELGAVAETAATERTQPA
jgi:HPt (histidine-containing phosphotransfer) domain-containing protein